MAVLAISNFYLYHVEVLADLTVLGSDNGIKVDTVAWVEATKNWYYPATISASSSTWAVSTGFQSTGAVGSEPQQYSETSNQTLTAGTSNALVATLKTLDTNGQNAKVIVKATAVDIDTNFVAFTYEQYFYRASGTVSSVGVFDNQQNAVGTGEFTGNVSFNVTAVGDDIRLRVSNLSSTVTYTLDIAAMWQVQEGGF